MQLLVPSVGMYSLSLFVCHLKTVYVHSKKQIIDNIIERYLQILKWFWWRKVTKYKWLFVITTIHCIWFVQITAVFPSLCTDPLFTYIAMEIFQPCSMEIFMEESNILALVVLYETHQKNKFQISGNVHVHVTWIIRKIGYI